MRLTLAEAQTSREPSDAPKGKPKSREEFLRIARKRFDRVMKVEAMNRQMAVEDLKFKKGDQWPEDIRASRTLEKRPCLTINKIPTFTHQITNDQRQNRPAINVSPIGDKSDPNTAKMLKGLIRQIERQSNADVAYDTGFDSAVSCGWGYWRVLTEYEDEDSFDQVIRIGRIRNPFRVYLDPDHQEPDGSDAKWGFVSDLITREDYESQYPKGDKMPWEQGGLGDEYKEWSTQTHIRLAEYFYFENTTRKLVHLQNGHVGYEDELSPELKAEAKANPAFVDNEREVTVRKIHWDTISAKEVLEEHEWAGKWIPIVKVIGDEIDVEGKVYYSGIIRNAKDSQRMKNYWSTSKTELIALAPKAPFIMEEGQVETHEQRWKDANQKSYPYLLYKGVSISGKAAPPPQRQQLVGPAAGMIEAEQSAEQDMMGTTGIRFDSTKQERTYDESGKALRELRKTTDLGSFHYIDNHARALRHTGRILIDLIPKIYDTARVVTILREDDSEEQVKIEPSLGVPHQTRPGMGGKIDKLYNPKLGNYEVMVTIGPSYSTKRAEAADSMMAFLKVMPQSAQLIGDLVAKNMDWPGAEDISARLAAMLPPQVAQMLGKNMADFPPEAKAMVMNLQTQLQQVTKDHKQALHLLGEKQTEQMQHQVEIETARQKVEKDFEAKLIKVVAEMQDKHLGHVKDIALQVKTLEQQLEIKNKDIAAGEKEKTSLKDANSNKLAESLKSVGDSQGKVAEALKTLATKKKKARMKGPSGKVYEYEED